MRARDSGVLRKNKAEQSKMSHPVQALGHFLEAGKLMSFVPTSHWEDPSA